MSMSSQTQSAFDTSADNLLVVLRETFSGTLRKAEVLEPFGKSKVKLPDGREVEVDLAAYAYLGDMHVRFVFDGPTSMRNASSQDLARLKLSPEEALKVAVANLRRVYGPPTVVSWTGGLLQVKGKSPDLDSSFFLDKQFWSDLSKKYPEGIVAAVPKRGGVNLCASLRHRDRGRPAERRGLPACFKRNPWRVVGSLSLQGWQLVSLSRAGKASVVQ
jgi:hypothetical protein